MDSNVSLSTVGVEENQITQQIETFTQWEEFISAGAAARQFKDQAQWVLGKLAAGIEIKYGVGTLEKYAKEIKIPVSSLRVYRWVVSQYEKDYVPPPTVSFGALEAVAKLPPPIRAELLDKVENEGMSIENIRRQISKNKNEVPKPKFRVEFCSAHQKWYFVPVDLREWEPMHDF